MRRRNQQHPKANRHVWIGIVVFVAVARVVLVAVDVVASDDQDDDDDSVVMILANVAACSCTSSDICPSSSIE